MTRINKESKAPPTPSAPATRAPTKPCAGVLVDLIRNAEKLARWMQKLP